MAIWSYFAFDQALRAILESIRKGVRSHVTDRETLSLLHEYEIHTAGQVLYGPGLDVTGHTNPLVQGCTAQRRDFRDGVVISLALLGSDIRQTGERNDDDAGPNAEFQFAFHRMPPANFELPYVEFYHTPDEVGVPGVSLFTTL
jgi:hypothetical protein